MRWPRFLRRSPQDAPIIAPALTFRNIALPDGTLMPVLNFPNAIKSDHYFHSWRVVGAYDPELDGDDPSYGRRAVACMRCGEQRRIGCSLDDPRLKYGCVRTGFTGTYELGDHVLVGNRLDRFVKYLPNGQCQTVNGGGGRYVQHLAELQPRVPTA